MFGYTELYAGYDQVKFNEIRDRLKGAGINYHDSVKDSSGAGAGDRRIGLGSAGENASYRMEYKISVKKDELEKAKYIIRNGN